MRLSNIWLQRQQGKPQRPMCPQPQHLERKGVPCPLVSLRFAWNCLGRQDPGLHLVHHPIREEMDGCFRFWPQERTGLDLDQRLYQW